MSSTQSNIYLLPNPSVWCCIFITIKTHMIYPEKNWNGNKYRCFVMCMYKRIALSNTFLFSFVIVITWGSRHTVTYVLPIGSFNTSHNIVGTDLIGLEQLGNFFAWSAVMDGVTSSLTLLLVGMLSYGYFMLRYVVLRIYFRSSW